jgi:hypothetical protein
MAWAPIDSGLRDHPKLFALMAELDCNHPTAMGILANLWTWGMGHVKADGEMPAMNEAALANVFRVFDGSATKVRDALVKVKFLDRKRDVFYVHDWQDHGGRHVVQLEKNRQRARENYEKSTRRIPVVSEYSPREKGREEKGEEGKGGEGINPPPDPWGVAQTFQDLPVWKNKGACNRQWFERMTITDLQSLLAWAEVLRAALAKGDKSKLDYLPSLRRMLDDRWWESVDAKALADRLKADQPPSPKPSPSGYSEETFNPGEYETRPKIVPETPMPQWFKDRQSKVKSQ